MMLKIVVAAMVATAAAQSSVRRYPVRAAMVT